MTAEFDFAPLLDELRALSGEKTGIDELLSRICLMLQLDVPHYDWVGFYLVSGHSELELGPYAGEPTGHTNIPFGRGVCGRVAASGKKLVVQDVSAEENYLSCSAMVKSEIVVPLFRRGEMAGLLDIDSHSPAPFTGADVTFLEEVCRMAGERLE